MRRSTMWFLIAGFWLMQTAIAAYRHRTREMAVTLAAVAVFAALGIGYRRVESSRIAKKDGTQLG